MTILREIVLGFGVATLLSYGAYVSPTPYYKLKNHYRNHNTNSKPPWAHDFTSKPLVSALRKPILYLTFDDGPSQFTSTLLDLLEDCDIPATFFVVGEYALKYPQLIKRMVSEGHAIGYHSDCHKNQLLSTPAQSKRDALSTAGKLSVLGVYPVLFRPPWLQMNAVQAKLVRDQGWQVQLADLLIGDWKGNETPTHLAEKLLRKVKDGDVICLHDGRGDNHAPLRTIQALKLALPKLLDQGYEFRKIEVQYETNNH